MLLTKIKSVFVTFAMVTLASLACVLLATGQTTEKPKSEQPNKAPAPQDQKDKAQANLGRYLESQSWALTKVNTENNTVSARLYRFAEMDLFVGEELFEDWLTSWITVPTGQFNVEGLPVSKDAKIVIDGKRASLKDLKRKMRVSLRLAPDDGHITQIEATSPEQAVLKATDVAGNTITVTKGGKELLLTPAVNAKYLFLGGKEGEFTDLKPGMRVDLQLGYRDGKILVAVIKAGK